MKGGRKWILKEGLEKRGFRCFLWYWESWGDGLEDGLVRNRSGNMFIS